MFKSNLTHTIYAEFISSYLTKKIINQSSTDTYTPFVYVDSKEIKYMAGYSQESLGPLKLMQFNADKNNPLRITIID